MANVNSYVQKLLNEPPYVLTWSEPDNPLPVRTLQALKPRRRRHPLHQAAPWFRTRRPSEPFDFCLAIRRLCEDVVRKSEELNHIDTDRLLFAVTQARNNFAHGLQARVTPLRFAGGQLMRRRRGVIYQVQRYFHNNVEFLYLVTFCLPRFLNQDFDNKLITLIHELYHIGPNFDGDLRRHKGRYSIHTHSQKNYDDHMAALARDYINSKPDASRLDFLRLEFGQLEQRHGSVTGIVVPRPKIVPLAPRRKIG